MADPRVGVLREVLRHFQEWRAVYEAEGVEVLRCPDGSEWSIWDIDYLLRETLPKLPKRQRESIWYCLILGMREEDVAILMQLKPTNPVAMYATAGIVKILVMIDEGTLPRFQVSEVAQMRMKYGTNWVLEAEADRLIRESLANVTSHTAKRDILTPWKEKDRRRREVYNGKGVADASLRRGMFARAANLQAPHLNANEGKVAPLGRTYEHPDHEAGGDYAGEIDLESFL